MGNRNNKLFNYLINTFGISKEMIITYVKERTDEVLSKNLSDKLNSKYIENLILNKITSIIQEGFTSHSYWLEKRSFENFVKVKLKEVIEEFLVKHYDFEMKVIHKDKTVVHRVE